MVSLQLVFHFSFFALATCAMHAIALRREAICMSRCALGRGGNLCKCTAMHFAGKRGVKVELDGTGMEPAEFSVSDDGLDDIQPGILSTLRHRDVLEESYPKEEDRNSEKVLVQMLYNLRNRQGERKADALNLRKRRYATSQ